MHLGDRHLCMCVHTKISECTAMACSYVSFSVVKKQIYVSLHCYSHCNISESQHHQRLNQGKMKRPAFHNKKQQLMNKPNLKLITRSNELFSFRSCFLKNVLFYKQLVAEQITLHGEPARYAGRRGCRHCES